MTLHHISSSNDWRIRLGRGAQAALSLIALLWCIFLLQVLFPGLIGWGLRPRSFEAPQGLVLAHVLHGGVAHLVANTVPLFFLSWLLWVWSPVLALRSLLFSAASASLITWVFAPAGSIHIGASGLVFGCFGIILVNGLFRRSLGWSALAVLVALLYGGGLAAGILAPDQGVSWAMHAGGFLGGAYAGWMWRDRQA
ncbi:MAG: rhomboid family intramembrane serine protease [Planctomycetota bacterium]|nr:MAG: rhomboid family intramembrane serine protease [Planctomycetota bacterium]